MTRLSEWEEFQDDDLELGTADLLLDGALTESDVPPGYENIAALVKTVKQGLRPDEMDWEPPVVAAMMSAIRQPVPVRRQRTRPRLALRPQVAIAVGAIGILSGGAAAAAAGSLPATVQTAVHNVASSIGVAVPVGGTVHHSAIIWGHTSRTATPAISRPGSSGLEAPVAFGKMVAAEKDAASKGIAAATILLRPPASNSAGTTPTSVETTSNVPGTTSSSTSATTAAPITNPPPTTPSTTVAPTAPKGAGPGSNGQGHSGKSSSSHTSTVH